MFLLSGVLKGLWLVVCISGIYMLFMNTRKQGFSKVGLQLDLMSLIEVSTTLAFSVVLVGSVPTTESVGYMNMFLLVLIIILFFEFKRLIVVGDEVAIIRGEIIQQQEIMAFRVSFNRLIIKLMDREVSIYAPLCGREHINRLLINANKID